MNHYAKRRRANKHALIIAIAVLTSLAALSIPSSALATPKGIFAKFKYCPTGDPGVAICSYGETTSGEFAIGKTKVPIEKTTIIQQGGGLPTGINLNEYFLLPATNGESLSKNPLNVPGGLLDLVNCKEIKGEGIWEKIERGACELVFVYKNNTTGVTATTELVANEHNPAILSLGDLLFEEGTALTLPVRVHLNNPFLGESCYIGSEAHPIQLHLTTGTTSPPGPNKPIKGKRGTGTGEEENELEIAKLSNNSLVDNAFSVPTAEGCGGFFSFLIDPVVNAKLGLESKAGNNTAILNGTLYTAAASSVVESEKF
jgi:hypothetical protein